VERNFDECLKMLLKHEGGFVNHPKDPGGMTNLGVTKRALEEYLAEQEGRDMEVSEAIMRMLTPTMVAPIYRTKYWNRVRGDDLPTGVDWAVFDWAVNSGVSRSAKALQHIIGATEDGIIGLRTLRQLGKFPEKDVIQRMHDVRQRFYESLGTFDTFGKGWTKRNQETLEQALEMAE